MLIITLKKRYVTSTAVDAPPPAAAELFRAYIRPMLDGDQKRNFKKKRQARWSRLKEKTLSLTPNGKTWRVRLAGRTSRYPNVHVGTYSSEDQSYL